MPAPATSPAEPARERSPDPAGRQRHNLRLVAIDYVARITGDHLGDRHAHLIHDPRQMAECRDPAAVLRTQPAQATPPVGRALPRHAVGDREIGGSVERTVVFFQKPGGLILQIDQIQPKIDAQLGVRIRMRRRTDKSDIHGDLARHPLARIPFTMFGEKAGPPIGGCQALADRGGSEDTAFGIRNIAALVGSSAGSRASMPNRRRRSTPGLAPTPALLPTRHTPEPAR
jgi:hypothetical protein